jgi:ribosomal protein S8E
MSAVGYVVKAMTLTVKIGTAAETSHQCEITGVTETETHSEQTSTTACTDGTIVDVGPSSWSVAIAHNVSLLPTSLFRLLRLHAGEEAVVTIEPFPVQEPGHKIQWTVTLVPSGGDFTVGSFATSTPPLPVKGAPVHIDPVAP